MAKLIEVSEREAMSNATVVVELKVKRSFGVWLGLRLIVLGCWIAGIGFEEKPGDANDSD